jgi:hypothetical protein
VQVVSVSRQNVPNLFSIFAQLLVYNTCIFQRFSWLATNLFPLGDFAAVSAVPHSGKIAGPAKASQCNAKGTGHRKATKA